MSDDIVERLRDLNPAWTWGDWELLCTDAANEIEEWRQKFGGMLDNRYDWRREANRLQSLIDALAEAWDDLEPQRQHTDGRAPMLMDRWQRRLDAVLAAATPKENDHG